jgi:hypothetical protein
MIYKIFILKRLPVINLSLSGHKVQQLPLSPEEIRNISPLPSASADGANPIEKLASATFYPADAWG